jgi:prevent-host-death family protein
MVNNMTMIVVNIFEAKAKLSEYLEMAAHGERVLICKRNRPVAELHAVESARTAPRPIGVGRGRVAVPPAFFDPLPEEMLNAFEGIAPLAGAAARYDERVDGAGALRAAEVPPAEGFGIRTRRGKRS